MKTPLTQLLKKTLALNAAAQQSGFNDPIEFYELQQYTRRDFIKTAALGTLAVGATACAKKLPNNIKVAVVGAGFAGLHAAQILQKGGIKATVFEASKRVGGRVFSAQDLLGTGLTTELGAEFIDSNHQDVWNKIREFNLQYIDLEKDIYMNKNSFYFAGANKNDKDAIKAFQPFSGKLIRHTQRVAANPNTRREMDYISIKEYLERVLQIDGWIKDLLEVAYTTEYGRETSEQSSLNLLEMMNGDFSKGNFDAFGISDERYKIIGGNQQIATKMAEQLAEQIEYRCTLEAIKKDATGKYILSFKQENKTVDVTAECVVLALPAAILKTIDLDKSLNISEEKKNAIAKYQVGNSGKFFLGFEHAVWREQGQQGFLLTDNPHLQFGWDNSQMQEKRAAGYTVFYGGNASKIFGKNELASLKSQVLLQARGSFKGIYEAYNYQIERFHWATNKYSEGAYSCHAPGHYHEVMPFLGTREGNLFFAGEHCSYEFQGFMNGALLTGRLAAEAILGK